MFNIDWTKIGIFLTPWFWRRPTHISWINVWLFPFKLMWNQFLVFKAENDYLNNYTSQIVYLEKILNDKWDPINKLIYIDNIADLERNYIFNKIEQKTNVFFYNKWTPDGNYIVLDEIVWNLKVYKAILPSSSKQPDLFPGIWAYVKDAPILRNKIEYYLHNDFIVYVPMAVVFDEPRMRATIDLYRYAGLNYTIIRY